MNITTWFKASFLGILGVFMSREMISVEWVNAGYIFILISSFIVIMSSQLFAEQIANISVNDYKFWIFIIGLLIPFIGLMYLVAARNFHITAVVIYVLYVVALISVLMKMKSANKDEFLVALTLASSFLLGASLLHSFPGVVQILLFPILLGFYFVHYMVVRSKLCPHLLKFSFGTVLLLIITLFLQSMPNPFLYRITIGMGIAFLALVSFLLRKVEDGSIPDTVTKVMRISSIFLHLGLVLGSF
ncbi:MAG: hypothetical protein INQ03_22470 [Candidatus Heimdallarchaeota archaeon]|nr:hypothetical protein [Candidatus Heimdallarchaeota archaeon]